MKKLIVGLVTAALATLALVAIDVTPAAAAYSCTNGHACLYQYDGTGVWMDIVFSQTPPGCHNVVFKPIDGYKSAISLIGSGYSLIIYHGANCTQGLSVLFYNETFYSLSSINSYQIY